MNVHLFGNLALHVILQRQPLLPIPIMGIVHFLYLLPVVGGDTVDRTV
jgi:hypothetical protein